MTKKYRYFPEDVKRAAVKRMADGEAASTVARDIGADRLRLYEWYHKYREGGPEGLRRVGRPRRGEALSARGQAWKDAPDENAALRRQIAELERKIGQQQVDLDFFRRALRHVEETRRAQAAPGAAASIKSSKR
jgi:transposase-like protein